MFVLGACWVRDPPRTVLGLKAHILVQFCNPNVKTPHFVVTKHVEVKDSYGCPPLFWKCNVSYRRSTHGPRTMGLYK